MNENATGSGVGGISSWVPAIAGVSLLACIAGVVIFRRKSTRGP
jgi:LPXTG-motif cell wall-anchored protein